MGLRPPNETISPNDVRAAASLCAGVLRPVADLDWDRPARDLEWSCHVTLAHMLSALLYYAINLATQSVDPRPSGQADPSLPVAELLDALEARADLLAAVCETAPSGARGAHTWGSGDAAGFAALGCNELTVHTGDITAALEVEFRPPPDICGRTLTRLFPWAPQGGDPWETLAWANGRRPLGDLPRLPPSWLGHPAPLEEWDGEKPSFLA